MKNFTSITLLFFIGFSGSLISQTSSKISNPEDEPVLKSTVQYSINNLSITGANQFIEFDTYVASLINNEEYFAADILISYNDSTFGSYLASSGRLVLTSGTVLSNSNYTINLTDASQNQLLISIQSSSNYYTITSTPQQLLHFKIDITNLAGAVNVKFDEVAMQNLSKYYNNSLNIGTPFDVVLASDELNLEVDGLECICSFDIASNNSWYYKGQLTTTAYQEDTYVFRLNSLQAYTGTIDPIVVDSLFFVESNGMRFNVLFFNNNSSINDRENMKNQIRSDLDFSIEFPAVTSDPNNSYLEEKWMYSNDIVNVGFKNPIPDPLMLQYIETKYNVSLNHQPNPVLPIGINSWTFAFKINPNGCNCRNAIDLSRIMFENDSLILKFAEPWLEPFKDAGTTNDPYFGVSWHINNIGQCLGMDISGNGTLGADCNIEIPWTQGFTGNGVNVAVIDKSYFESNHPDISSKYVNGFDFIDSNSNVSYSSGVSLGSAAHGQACSGLIAAKANNNEGVVGVAYDAQITPIISWYGTAYKGFQHAMTNNVDVISCSWGWLGPPSQAIENDIALCKTLGRSNKGIVVVTSAGNYSNTNVIFPAYLNDVIAVIASNPDDYIKSQTDGWSTGWGSNYGVTADIAAPGTHLVTTGLMGTNINHYEDLINGCVGETDLNNNYTYFNGTSAAAPIVAGAAAILISKDTTLTAIQIQNILQSSADKVGGYNYNAVSAGRSMEMGYGRINFENMIFLGNIDIPSIKGDFTLFPNPANDIVHLNYTVAYNTKISISLLDGNGKLVKSIIDNKTHKTNALNKIDITTSYLAPGMYYIRIKSIKGSQSLKLAIF